MKRSWTRQDAALVDGAGHGPSSYDQDLASSEMEGSDAPSYEKLVNGIVETLNSIEGCARLSPEAGASKVSLLLWAQHCYASQPVPLK